ncbi:MAG: hypothetical protein V3U75_01375 [Methylococcaceae bacterium]
MEEFLKELEVLLGKHNATIVRSASSEHELVISVGKVFKHGIAPNFEEVSFDEEIGETQLRNQWYTAI